MLKKNRIYSDHVFFHFYYNLNQYYFYNLNKPTLLNMDMAHLHFKILTIDLSISLKSPTSFGYFSSEKLLIK